MKDRKGHTIDDINTLLGSILVQCKNNTNTNVLLSLLEMGYLYEDGIEYMLQFICGAHVRQPSKAGVSATDNLIQIFTKLADNPKTDIQRLIKLLSLAAADGEQTFSSYLLRHAIKSNDTTLVQKYLDLLLTISIREDADANDLQKLFSHHDERGQTPDNYNDGSILFDLAEIASKDTYKRHLLQNYLTNLVMLSDKGKINADTIFKALSKPKGSDKNIGQLIAKIYSTPDCYHLLAQLLRSLRNEGFHIKKFLPSIEDFNFHKETFLNYLRDLSYLETVNEGSLMGDPEDPVGKLMFEQRGFFACSLDSGVLKEVSVAVGSATIQITREARQTQQEIQIKGAINPVKAAVPNAPALEFEVSEGEALLKAPKEFQMPKLLRDEHNQDILGSHLIMAAAYKKNDEVKRLLSLGANVNYQHDMGYFYADATALYIAAEQNNLEGVDLLLQAGADINMQRGNRMSALCIALNNRHNQMALHLIQNGAEIDIFTREKNSPLSYARFCSDAVMEAMVNKLIEKYQKNPDDLFKFLETDRHYQKCIENVSSGKKLLILLKLRDFLIAAGFQQDKVNSLLPQEFSFAADNIKHDFLKAVEELPHAAKFNMLKRIVVDEKSWEYQFARFHRGALICRSGHGMLGEAEKLYNAHNVHIADEEKLIKARVEEKVRLNNALIIAASGNNSSQIEAINKIDELIAKGADVNAPFKRVDESSSGNDLTALAVAAANGKTDIVNHLLNKGADPALAVNTTKNNPMFSLKKFGHKYHDNIRNFLAQQSGENISILPEKMAEILREKTIAERLRTIRLEKLSESLQAISMEKDKPAAAQAAEIVFVPPQVTVAQPPSYADAEKMKEEERQAELKAGETAFVPPQRVYPSLASEQPVYIDETKKYIKAGAKLRELGEASQVKLVEVVQPVNPFADMEQIPDQPIAVKESGNPFDDENIQTTVNPFAEDLFAELLGNKTEETDSLETLMECFKPVEKKSVDELLSSDIPVNLPEPMLPTTAVVLQKLGSTPFDDMIDQQEAVKSAARTIFDDLLEQAAPAREPAISKEPVRSYAVPDDFNMQKVQAELDLTEGEHQSNMFTLFNADPAKPEKEIEFPELPDHLKKKSKSAKEKRSDNNQGGVLLAAK